MSRLQQAGPASGFGFRVDRARGPQWYAKWREPGGRQVKKRIGPARHDSTMAHAGLRSSTPRGRAARHAW